MTATLTERRAYTYRDDAAVPDLPDRDPIAFMDGNCVLCTFGARLIARHDHSGRIRICPIQSPAGRAVLRHYGLEPEDPDSWLFLIDGQAHTSFHAMIRAGAFMGGIGWLLQPLRLLPRPLSDWLYRRIARNRYSMLGETDMCAVPDPALRARLIE